MCYRCHKRIIYSLESVLLPLKTYYYNLYHNLLFLMYNIFLYTFSEYRFAIRACLNILPTKTVARRAGKTQLDTRCQSCKLYLEPLGHVLNICTTNSGLMRKRHNNILERLVKAIPPDLEDKFKEQKLMGFPGDLRSDLIIHNKDSGKVTIIEIVMPAPTINLPLSLGVPPLNT